MKLYIVTIVLDGQPFISHHIEEIRRCSSDWEWHIVEGASSNNADTSWCAKQDHRLSRDGTTEYIDKLSKSDPRVKVYRNKRWNSKTSMVNAAVANFREPGILLQMDVDEFWTGRQLDILVKMFKENPSYSVGQFYCRYFVGPDITTTGNFNYGNKPDRAGIIPSGPLATVAGQDWRLVAIKYHSSLKPPSPYPF